MKPVYPVLKDQSHRKMCEISKKTAHQISTRKTCVKSFANKNHLTNKRVPFLLECLIHGRDSKISQSHSSIRGQEDIGCLNVSVDHHHPMKVLKCQTSLSSYYTDLFFCQALNYKLKLQTEGSFKYKQQKVRFNVSIRGSK